jgi:hypothetical protein
MAMLLLLLWLLLLSRCSAGWRVLTEDHRIAVNKSEAARLSAKNSQQDRAHQRWGAWLVGAVVVRLVRHAHLSFASGYRRPVD